MIEHPIEQLIAQFVKDTNNYEPNELLDALNQNPSEREEAEPSTTTKINELPDALNRNTVSWKSIFRESGKFVGCLLFVGGTFYYCGYGGKEYSRELTEGMVVLDITCEGDDYSNQNEAANKRCKPGTVCQVAAQGLQGVIKLCKCKAIGSCGKDQFCDTRDNKRVCRTLKETGPCLDFYECKSKICKTIGVDKKECEKPLTPQQTNQNDASNYKYTLYDY